MPIKESFIYLGITIYKNIHKIARDNFNNILVNDDSGLCISSMQKRMLFAGFTAVKKTIIQNWFTPHV